MVALMDADFILGAAWCDTLRNSLHTFNRSPSLAVQRFRIPILWDHFKTDSQGRITSHGRYFQHGYSHRIMRRDAVTYKQTGTGGKWEKLYFTTSARVRRQLNNEDGRLLVSVNVKAPERLELRSTMTTFLQDAIAGEVSGGWLEHNAADLRSDPPYNFTPAALSARLNLANVDLKA